MSRANGPPLDPSLLVWERSEPVVRPAPAPLSRDMIVRAAMAIADRDGLEAVSLRKVGASLDVGAMRLYGYMSTKEELLDLMVDAVYGEMTATGGLDGDWRSVLQTVAHRTRQAYLKHPWFVDLLAGRPHLGPNTLAFLEASFAALNRAPGFEDIDRSMQALEVVKAFVIGALRGERSEFNGGQNKTERQEAWGPYLERMIATERFPMLTKVVREAHHVAPEVVFERGLETVLEGLEAQLRRRAAQTP